VAYVRLGTRRTGSRASPLSKPVQRDSRAVQFVGRVGCGTAGGLRIGGSCRQAGAVRSEGHRPPAHVTYSAAGLLRRRYCTTLSSDRLPRSPAAVHVRSAIDCPLMALGGVAAVDEEVDVGLIVEEGPYYHLTILTVSSLVSRPRVNWSHLVTNF